MSDHTDAVLADIDGALAAYGTVVRDPEVSLDAMRWTPEKPQQPPACLWQPARLEIRIDVSDILAAFGAMSQAISDMGAVLLRAACEVAPLAAAAFGYSWTDGKLHYHAADASRRVRRRCPACHPLAFQPPCPDGAYYRHRQLARRRRNRRR